MDSTTFNVEMSCEGCSNACKRILNKVEGVEDVSADLTAQQIHVKHKSTVSREDMLAKLKKWGDTSGKKVALA